MVLVYLLNGECEEVEEAMSVNRVGEHVLCFAADGAVVRAFASDQVSLFTADPETARLVREEVCPEDEPTASGAL